MRGMIFNRVPLMITCRQLDEFIIDYLEGALPKRQKIIFELHLIGCPECRDYLVAYRLTMAIVKRVSENGRPQVAKTMPADLIKAIQAAHQS
jgi:predicted anti-sigma-YlaC factor YlaD